MLDNDKGNPKCKNKGNEQTQPINISFKACKLWNALPFAIINASNLEYFQKLIKTHLLN